MNKYVGRLVRRKIGGPTGVLVGVTEGVKKGMYGRVAFGCLTVAEAKKCKRQPVDVHFSWLEYLDS